MSTLCHACERQPATFQESCDNPAEPYYLCSSCQGRLHSRSLRPLEWYNLAKRHGWHQFLLHDDFYEQDGVASQPEADVYDAGSYPIPSFPHIRNNPELLLDWSITRWHLTEQEIKAWSAISHEQRLRILSNRFSSTSSAGIRSRILEVIARTGDSRFADFVRYVWAEFPENIPLGSLAEASANCLPLDEGFRRVVLALNALTPRKRLNAIHSLGYFRSPEGLDWIESNFFNPLTEKWGYLAAMCRPSWTRLSNWFQQGRPFSLIAIDTLATIARQRHGTELAEAPSVPELLAVLREYEKRDPVPRVTQRVAWLVQNLDQITKT